MNPYIYGVRLPLFLNDDEIPSEELKHIEQFNSDSVTIPISYSLIDVLQHASPSNSANKNINLLLDSIIKSPSFFFPDLSFLFERQGLAFFVPDDNQEHWLNWKSIILQLHISFLNLIGWENVSKSRSSAFSQNRRSNINMRSDIDIQNSSSEFNRSKVNFGTTQGPSTLYPSTLGQRPNLSRNSSGGMSLRSQTSCIGSFSNRSTTGSLVSPSFQDILYQSASPINREVKNDDSDQYVTTDINQLFDFQLSWSFEESSLFRATVLAIHSKGLFDRSLGMLMASQLSSEISSAGFQANLGRIVDTSSVFDNYYNLLLMSLLTPDDEEEIKELVAKDKIDPILTKFDGLYPFKCIPHVYNFIESILAPLCFHENDAIALKATKQLMTLFNGHEWELKNVQVTTAESAIEFKGLSEHVILLSGPSQYGNTFSTFKEKSSFVPINAGFYDYAYGRITEFGEIEIDQTMQCGRYIVLPSCARKEIIHELPAFDDHSFISFDQLTNYIQTLHNSGATAVHVTGVIERNFLHDLTSVTDHTVFSKKCGGLNSFKEFCNKANQLGLRVLIDFSPLVCLRNASKKYAPYATLTADIRGRLITSDIPETEMMLLNYRSLSFWNMLTEEILELLDSCCISGFYLGSIEHWDTVLPRDLNELMRLDPDDTPHYQVNNIIEGTIITSPTHSEFNNKCSLCERHAEYSPHLFKIMRKIWSKRPNAFVWVQCPTQFEPFAIKSGLIPANYNFRNVMQCSIEYSVHNNNVDTVNANENLINLYIERQKRNPPGSLLVAPFGALMDGPYNLPNEGLQLAIDMLFFLSDVPLISGCLDTAMFYANAYSTIKQVREKNAKWPSKWYPPSQQFNDCLKYRASKRSKVDWALAGDVKVLPVSYDGHPMRAILAVSRTCPNDKRCFLMCSSFYMFNLIYEVTVNSLSIFDNRSPDSIVRVSPLLNVNEKDSYYSINEVKGTGSTFFLELAPFQTALYEISIIEPPIPNNISRMLMEDAYLRLQRAIEYESRTVLSNNNIFNTILNAVDENRNDDQIIKLVSSLPNANDIPNNLCKALYNATRNKRNDQNQLYELEDEEIIENREHVAMGLLHQIADSNLVEISKIGKQALKTNKLGPILFVAPELGPFSKVGGLSTMVWELAKELVNLGLDIHVVSPYYNVSPKGETGYLKKYNIEYQRTINIYCPNQIEIGIHYGIVDSVKCWFLHHYSFFAAPYQTGSEAFRLQLLVVMAKASLELCCQVRMIPSLIISNDWMTGLVPAMGRKQFGSVFDKTKFLHILHNLGVGYAGKIWPHNGDTGSLRYIHQLPDELIVDNFDHSIDPSLCALLNCDQWATVSKKYRQELLESSPYNWILRSFPRPFAYSNGIRFQERLDSLKLLGLTHEEAKRVVQKKYFGYVDDSMCLYVFVGRIVEQKGVYLIIDSFEELNRQYNGRLMFIVGGQAAPDDRSYGLPCTHRMWDLRNRYPKQFWADPSQFFSDGLLCCQAADYTMIPSLFEPSGIVQQEAFASGCPVISFRTGGLADTVFEFDREKKTGNGFVFLSHHHYDFILAVQRSVEVFRNKELYQILRKNAFKSTLSTETVAIAWSREFARLFMKIFEREEPGEIINPIQTPPPKINLYIEEEPKKPKEEIILVNPQHKEHDVHETKNSKQTKNSKEGHIELNDSNSDDTSLRKEKKHPNHDSNSTTFSSTKPNESTPKSQEKESSSSTTTITLRPQKQTHPHNQTIQQSPEYTAEAIETVSTSLNDQLQSPKPETKHKHESQHLQKKEPK